MWVNPEFPADLVTFTEEIFPWKLHFLCSDIWQSYLLSKLLMIRKKHWFNMKTAYNAHENKTSGPNLVKSASGFRTLPPFMKC